MEESLKIILEAVNRAQGELAAVAKDIDRITAATTKQAKAAAEADKIIQKQRGSLLAVGAAATAVAAGMLVLIKGALQLGDEFNALSQKTGVTVENLSTLAPVAKNANIELGGLSNGLKFLAKTAVDAQVAGSEGAKAFAALGTGATQANGQLKDTFTLLLDSADAFAAHADGAGKTALAMQIFGRAGQDLIPLLNQGRKGIEEQQEAIKALGGQMSGKFARDADAFNDQLNNLGVVLRGAAKEILTEMLPALKQLAELAIANKDTIVTAFKAIAVSVTAVGIAFAGFKAFSLIAALGQIIQLIPALVTGLGLAGGAATAAGTAAAAAAVSFGVALVAIAALTAVVLAGVKAWEAWGAAQKEAASEKGLVDSTTVIRTRLSKHTDDLRAAGKITEQEAHRIQKVLDLAQHSPDVGFQIAANKAVIAQIKDKIDGENRFASEAQKAAAQLEKQGDIKPSFTDPAVTAANLKQAQAEAEGHAAIGQAAIAQRTASQKAALAAEEAALERSLARQGISVGDYEHRRQALLAQRIADQIDAARFEAELAQEANAAKVAGTTDTAELAALNAQQAVAEVNLQTTLSEIAAQGEADRLDIMQRAVDETIKARGRQLDIQAGVGQAQGGADVAGLGLRQAQLEADLEARRISEFEFGQQQREIQLQGVEEERARAVETANIEAEKNALKLEALEVGSAERNALELADQFNHQNNLLTIEQDASTKRIKIATAEQEAKRALLSSQLEGTRFTLDLMTQAAQQFGKKGVAIAKVTATASALISTYQSAVAAYAAVAGIAFVGPVLAPIAAAAAVAAGLANIAKINSISFAAGGLVPGAPSNKDNRLANVATGEYIFPAAAVSRMGPAWFAALHQQILAGKFRGGDLGGPVPRTVMGNSFAGGGLVGPGGRASGDQPDLQDISVAFVNNRNALREFQRTDGIRLVVDQLEQRNNQVFS